MLLLLHCPNVGNRIVIRYPPNSLDTSCQRTLILPFPSSTLSSYSRVVGQEGRIYSSSMGVQLSPQNFWKKNKYIYSLISCICIILFLGPAQPIFKRTAAHFQTYWCIISTLPICRIRNDASQRHNSFLNHARRRCKYGNPRRLVGVVRLLSDGPAGWLRRCLPASDFRPSLRPSARPMLRQYA
jgi:hypothetical protein